MNLEYMRELKYVVMYIITYFNSRIYIFKIHFKT